MKWLKRIALGFAALLLLLALLGLDFVRSFARSVPSYDGSMAADVASPVAILRDSHAIPHIRAETYGDAAFALGFAHAQDRMWQMEVSRRAMAGRLAELFGGLALPNDRYMRDIGLYHAASSSVAHLAPETRHVLQRYADGVNAFLGSEAGRHLPLEFTLAGIRPEHWSPADSVAILKGMALQLSGNMGAEAARVRLMGLLGRSSVNEFMPPFEDALPEYLDTLFGATHLGRDISVPNISASNNWVVSGAHSASGKPLLANDPHLGFTLPSTWYLAHLSFAGENIAGGTLAGVPGIVAGRNAHVAWGLTNTGPDTQDLYLERLDPDNRARYQTPSGWAEFEQRREIIKVRFGRDVSFLARQSRHGPVLDTSADSRFADLVPRGYVVALAWTALDPADTTMDTIVSMGRARNAEEFRAASRATIAPMQNVVYADDTGEIGLVLPGKIPLRAKENDSLGLVPAPGWEGRYDWQGFMPPEAGEVLRNPASGRIVTANNRIVPEDFPYTLARDWDPPYRHDRIDVLLAATSRHTIGSFAAIQNDIVDTYAAALVPRLLQAGPFPAGEERAARLMANWDGAMRADRPQPLIFAAWARALARRIYGDELGEAMGTGRGYRAEFTLRVLDNVQGASRWCDEKGTPAEENCASRIRLALADAVAELSAEYGADPAAWRWGDAHPAIHAARPLSDIPLIGSYFRREVTMDGGPFTVKRADNAMSGPRPYAAIHGSGYRAIYDLGNADNSRYMISTGQSGNSYSPHYDDLLPLWANGAYVAIPFSREAVEENAAHRLALSPFAKASGAQGAKPRPP